MEALLSRYRNLTVLLLVILAQLVLLAWQVKSNQDVRMIRVWAVTAVTPMARVLEFLREHTIGVAENYFVLVNVRNDNESLKQENGRLKIENQFLRTELETAERAKALATFQERTPSRTLPSRIIGTGTGANSRVVFIDRGSTAGVKRGMAVITPDGIVGKVLASYPTASQVLLVTDATFGAGVISGKNRVHGTVKGIGQNKVIVDYVQNEEKVEVGEVFYTSGDDRIFPKGMPVGKVTVVRPGRTFKEIFLVPAAFQQGLEEVLVVIEGVNGTIPDAEEQRTTASPEVYLQPQEAPKPGAAGSAAPAAEAAPNPAAALSTDADRLRERYKQLGEQQGVKYGEGGKIPNFNAPITPQQGQAGAAGASGAAGSGQAGARPQTPSGAPPTAAPKPQTAGPVNGGGAGMSRPAGQQPAVTPPNTATPKPQSAVPTNPSGTGTSRPAGQQPAVTPPNTATPKPQNMVPTNPSGSGTSRPAGQQPAVTPPNTATPKPQSAVPTNPSGTGTPRPSGQQPAVTAPNTAIAKPQSTVPNASAIGTARPQTQQQSTVPANPAGGGSSRPAGQQPSGSTTGTAPPKPQSTTPANPSGTGTSRPPAQQPPAQAGAAKPPQTPNGSPNSTRSAGSATVPSRTVPPVTNPAPVQARPRQEATSPNP